MTMRFPGNEQLRPTVLIEFEHVSKSYGGDAAKVHALRDVSLNIPAGSLTVVLGPSGSGKTTLLNLLGGIDRATSGRIRLDGTDITLLGERDLGTYRREKVGFVFQFFNLIPSLTARENVALAAELVANSAPVEEVLRQVGLDDRLDHFPAELSGGEQQRVAIARALVKNPPLLLCDEPTGELDYVTGVRVLEILGNAAHGGGRAVIVVTHNAIIGQMADRVVRLRSGRIDRVLENSNPISPQLLMW
ncbi:MAG TPA: ABC transporter ATP-binding protein [Thermoplasmata archaeon]|nr:ABC transporter ATP-binding protein [Thermoplasmata archaeon]